MNRNRKKAAAATLAAGMAGVLGAGTVKLQQVIMDCRKKKPFM